MTPRTKLVEVWPSAWYLIVERMDKPAGARFGRVSHPDYPHDYATWTCWAYAIGPFPHSYGAHQQVKHYHPELGIFQPVVVRYETLAIHAPEIDRHVFLALAANAKEPLDLPEPIDPLGFDALDQVVTCSCGNHIPIEDMDEENGYPVVWCVGCRRSVNVSELLAASAAAYGEGD
jgi:hypothetical protein